MPRVFVDEDGRDLIWRPAIDPKLLVVGTRGKVDTLLLRIFLIQGARWDWPVWIVDGKPIALSSYRVIELSSYRVIGVS